jgi:hypothetical protein
MPETLPANSQAELTRLENLWRELNPHPTGSYAWYSWSMDVSIPVCTENVQRQDCP